MTAHAHGGAGSDRFAQLVTDKLAPGYVGATVIFLVAVRTAPSMASGVLGGVVGAVCTCIIPETVIRAGARRGRWDRHVQVRQQRAGLLSVALLSGLAGLVILDRLGASEVLRVVVGSGLVGVAVTMVVSLFWKTSVHAGAMWGATVYAYLLAGPVVGLVLTALSFLTMWSRVRLRQHTSGEVIVGALLGAGIALASSPLLP